MVAYLLIKFLLPSYEVGTSSAFNTQFMLLGTRRAAYWRVGVLVQFLSRKDCLPYLYAGASQFRRSSSRSPSNLQCGHVAAVCYRVRGGEPEFLLVRTRNGHWTFPKGRVDQDATNADAAAREAYEEAGVRGSVEPVPFVCYRHCKPRRLGLCSQVILVDAHLCKVKRLAPPLEEYRDPTWFSVPKAKRRLQKSRTSEFAAEVTSVIDRATERILNSKSSWCRAVSQR
jgi:8-oxo-dGTP pyrophosphatase MutT (NUDIX family)